MKNFFATAMGCLALSLLGCQDSAEPARITTPDIKFYRTIGHQISFDEGMAWIEAYKQKHSSMGRVGAYSIPASQYLEMQQSVQNLVGVAFHHAIDANGTAHVLTIPVDESLSLWASIPGRVIVDANTGNTISQSTAQAWAQRYKDENPGTIWFHFFGSDVLNDMVLLPFLSSVEIEPAININDGSPQMLLVVWNLSLNLFGRTAEGERAAVYDGSNPCPPCSVK